MKKKQIALIVGVVIVFVLLLFANTKLPSNKVEAEEESNSNMALDNYLSKSIDALSTSAKNQVKALQKEAEDSGNKQQSFLKLVHLLDSLRQPVAAALYSKQLAEQVSNEATLFEAANRIYNATRFVNQEIKAAFFEQAITLYQKTLELNANNTEAKISLAACYVEGSPDPMKGIGMLREIEKTDSNNVNLQMNFAFFSEKSGQWDKAIARFEKVLRIKPDFIEAYLHLADAYVNKGDKTKAIEALEKYKSLIDDTAIKTEISNYIDQLKTN
jgi:tetratricopeptide (TPR) repeat protein